jgi:phage terminase large subunit-like protein
MGCRAAAIRRMADRWPQAVVKLIEDKANGPAVINSLRQEVGGIIPVQVKDSKGARAAAVSPPSASGHAKPPGNATLDPLEAMSLEYDAIVARYSG